VKLDVNANPYTSAGTDSSKKQQNATSPAHNNHLVSPLLVPNEATSQNQRFHPPISAEKLKNPYVSPMMQVCVRVHSCAGLRRHSRTILQLVESRYASMCHEPQMTRCLLGCKHRQWMQLLIAQVFIRPTRRFPRHPDRFEAGRRAGRETDNLRTRTDRQMKS